MYDINCVDETFDPNFTTEYILSIQFSLDGFSFCIIDDIRKKHLIFKNSRFQLSNYSFLKKEITAIIKAEKILRKKYKKVIIRFNSPKFTLIPEAINNSCDKAIFEMNFDADNNEVIQTTSSEKYASKVVFSLPGEISGYLKSVFPNAEVSHHITILADILQEYENKGQPTAMISVSKRFFTLLVGKNNKLLFVNSFKYTNNMDFIYYLLNVFKSIGIEINSTQCFLCGEIKKDSYLVDFMRKHFNKVDFVRFVKGYQYSYTFANFPQHMFATVINHER